MHQNLKTAAWGLALGGVLAFSASALADPGDHPHRDRVHVGVHVDGGGHPDVHARFGHIDRVHRVPPDIRVHGFRGGNFHVRVNPFHNFRGARIARFSPHERAMWTGGHWWRGRHHGHFGWWWWVDGGWFFYNAPVYPYPDYVSEEYYEEPSQDYGDYWYYCRDPRGYYPYVQQCNGQWEPVPAQPAGADNGGPGGNDGDYDNGPGPGDDEMGPDDNGPPDEDDQDDQGPPPSGPPPGY
ncbi:MAG TPA: hypothetical protein VIM02_15250 [Rhizomicrobium sp.]|jgi:hypothetical protein